MNSTGNVGGDTAGTAATPANAARKPPMVSGAKVGLALVGLYVVLLASAGVWGEALHQAVGTSASEGIGYGVLFGLPVLIGLAGLATGLQKGRPGIGALALVLTPVGFFIALAAKPGHPSPAPAPAAVLGRPTGVAVVGFSLLAVSALRLLFLIFLNQSGPYGMTLLGVGLMPVDFSGMWDIPWLAPLLNVWPFYFFGVNVFVCVAILVTFLLGIFLLAGAEWARRFYLGWGAFGLLEGLYYPKAALLLRVLIFAAFAAVLLWPTAAAFFRKAKPERMT